MAVTGRQVSWANLLSQQAMRPSAIATLSSASSRAFCGSVSFLNARAGRAAGFQPCMPEMIQKRATFASWGVRFGEVTPPSSYTSRRSRAYSALSGGGGGGARHWAARSCAGPFRELGGPLRGGHAAQLVHLPEIARVLGAVRRRRSRGPELVGAGER